jgi:photosystem II stability/assembly factor-like uncharacterized protein
MNFKKIIIVLFTFASISDAQWVYSDYPGSTPLSFTSLGNYLFIGTISSSNDVVFRSSDNGNSWVSTSQGLPSSYANSGGAPNQVSKLLVKGNTIFVGLLGSGIFRSTDNGQSWIAANSGINNLIIWDIAIYHDTLYALTESTLIRSDNNGLTWKSVAENVNGYKLIITESAIYVGTSYTGLWWSTDNCKTWQKEKFGMETCVIESLCLTDNSILVGCRTTYSAIGGNKYLTFKMNADHSYSQVFNDEARAFISYDKYILMICVSRVLRSNDQGQSWNIYNDGIPDVNKYPYNFFSAGSNNDYVFIGVVSYYTPKATAGIWRRPISELTDIQNINIGELITSYHLAQNYPNPFNPTTLIEYEIPTYSNVRIEVFDAIGREIETLLNKEQAPGNYRITFDAATLSSGIYFYTITANNFYQTKKMILLR